MKICIIGEAYGEQEALTKRPFIGPAGQELRKMLREGGIDPNECHFTNVFNFRPENNNLRTLCLSKVECIKALATLRQSEPSLPWPVSYNFQALAGPGLYLHPKFLPELWRLRQELAQGQWSLCIPVGNTACWALLGHTGISRLRGYFTSSSLVGTTPVFPTYHPSAVLQNWSLRPIVIADFAKAKAGPRGEQASKEIWIEPGLEDISRWTGRLSPDETLSIDIETKPKARLITCIGFGTKSRAICIPFVDRRKKDKNYWKTPQEEIAAWLLVRALLESPNTKVWQNGNYDMQWLFSMGLVPKGQNEDTMLIHHALQPEMEKSLEFLASIYSSHGAWKGMRKKAKLSLHGDKADD